jgi:hypothetical protein
MPSYIYVPGSSPLLDGQDFRVVKNIWGNVPSVGWKRAKVVYVYNGTSWNPVHYATPGSVSLNYLAPSQISENGTQATFTSTVSWTPVDSVDTGITATAFYDDLTLGQTQSFYTASSPLSVNFTLQANQSKQTRWRVYLQNGPNTGPLATSATQNSSYQGTASAVNSVAVSVDAASSTISVSWSPVNFPSGGSYVIEWQVGTDVPGSITPFPVPSTFYNIASSSHGYTFTDSGGTTVTVAVTVRMYNGGSGTGTNVATGTGSTTAQLQGGGGF